MPTGYWTQKCLQVYMGGWFQAMTDHQGGGKSTTHAECLNNSRSVTHPHKLPCGNRPWLPSAGFYLRLLLAQPPPQSCPISPSPLRGSLSKLKTTPHPRVCLKNSSQMVAPALPTPSMSSSCLSVTKQSPKLTHFYHCTALTGPGIAVSHLDPKLSCSLVSLLPLLPTIQSPQNRRAPTKHIRWVSPLVETLP